MQEPKIHLSKVPQPGQLPYSVAVERRKLALASVDYMPLLEDFLVRYRA